MRRNEEGGGEKAARMGAGERGKTRQRGGMKKRGRQRRRGQGGAVQTGTKLETQCVVIHSSPQLLCACLCLSVWVSACRLLCVCVCTIARPSEATEGFFSKCQCV